MTDLLDSANLLARDAVKIARLRARSMLKTSKGVAGFYPIAKRDGTFGIGITPRYYYMYFQNTGIRPFTMWSLEGKTIPMRLPDGRVVYRKATGVGKPGRIAKRDEKGRIMKGNVGVRWRHPGLAPKNFIEFGLEQAAKKNYGKVSVSMFSRMIAESLGEAYGIEVRK